MKARELMIGDWVRVTHINKVGKVYRVDEANGDGNGWVAVIDGDYYESNIEPIPLSAEFFDSIGWHRMEGGKYDKRYFWADDFCEMTAHEFNDGMWHVEHDCIEMGGIPIESVNIGWVHELQHFITHCSVDMEIKLKKESESV